MGDSLSTQMGHASNPMGHAALSGGQCGVFVDSQGTVIDTSGREFSPTPVGALTHVDGRNIIMVDSEGTQIRRDTSGGWPPRLVPTPVGEVREIVPNWDPAAALA